MVMNIFLRMIAFGEALELCFVGYRSEALDHLDEIFELRREQEIEQSQQVCKQLHKKLPSASSIFQADTRCVQIGDRRSSELEKSTVSELGSAAMLPKTEPTMMGQ
jgi:hypothetical protein